MSQPYRVLRIFDPGLLELDHVSYGRQVWLAVTLQRHYRCARCQANLELGTRAYRPLTVNSNRLQRLCLICTAHLCARFAVQHLDTWRRKRALSAMLMGAQFTRHPTSHRPRRSTP